MPINVVKLEAVSATETSAELGQKTGLSWAKLLLRLNVVLPKNVYSFTPNGGLPTESEAKISAWTKVLLRQAPRTDDPWSKATIQSPRRKVTVTHHVFPAANN